MASIDAGGEVVLQIEPIVTVIVIAREKSFKGAAAVLRRSPAAVSRHVEHVETELGQILFKRNHGAPGVRLTPWGTQFVFWARAFLTVLRMIYRRAGRAEPTLELLHDQTRMDVWGAQELILSARNKDQERAAKAPRLHATACPL
ncbi:LysR family transcriptional regulator [Promicromonospora aerolata]|uniref:LysR family transcriptional regulator n=1 Tax=Promicromonospora aerolata TaxID=195749 RepID=A0ABW4V9J1_9MICO